MKLKKIHWIGIIFGAILLAVDLIFFLNKENRNMFLFLLGIVFAVVFLPFIIDLVAENKREQKINEMFLEFSRNLAESVSTGTPISKSIVNMRNKNYGVLSPHIQKLSNQISIGVPVNRAMQNFVYDVNNPVITRAITLIREAEKAGGEIDYILESAAKSIAEVEKLKKERKAAIYSLVVQGYIIFFIFIGIMLVMQFKILPLTTNVNAVGLGNAGNTLPLTQQPAAPQAQDLTAPFLYLLLAQGFFAGLTIGKLTEGNLKAGLKHSFVLIVTAFLFATGAKLFLS